MIIGGKVTFKTPQGFEHKGAVVELSFDHEGDLDRASALAQKKALEMVGLSVAGLVIPPITVDAAVTEMIHDQHGPAAPAPTSEKTTVRKMPAKKKVELEDVKAAISGHEKLSDALGDVPQIRSNPEARVETPELVGDAPITDKDLGDHCNRAAGKLLTTHGAEASKKVRELIQKYAPRVAEIKPEQRKKFLEELAALK